MVILMPFHVGRYSNSSKNLHNRYIHLTNYSINRHNADYEPNSDEEACQGHKWYEELDVCVIYGLRLVKLAYSVSSYVR